MTWPVSTTNGAAAGVVERPQPAVQAQPRPAEGDPANDWLCAGCRHRVASEKDRFHYEGQSEFSFENPEGIRFHILTFSRTLGGREVGIPTLIHTWFPGHAWSYCLCARCHMHLGWYYSGPADFVGLIRDRILRAALLWN